MIKNIVFDISNVLAPFLFTEYHAKQIMSKLISFSNEHNHLLDREKKELKKYSTEKKTIGRSSFHGRDRQRL